MGKPVRALLEDWMRAHYSEDVIDLGSSGLSPVALSELRVDGLIDQLLRTPLYDGSPYGSESLRRLVACSWGTGDPDSVMITHGSSEALFLACAALLEAGDSVVVQSPTYHSLRSLPRLFDCKTVEWPLPLDGRRPDFDLLETLLRGSPRALIVNFPHNPTGISLNHEELRRIAALSIDYDVQIIWDGAFADLIYDGDRFPAVTAADLPVGRSIYTGTLSKAYCSPGLRVGWCIADPSLLHASLAMRDVTTLHLSPAIELMATVVLKDKDRILGPKLLEAQGNLDQLKVWLATEPRVVADHLPDGGVTLFPRVEGIRDTTPLCRRLSEEDLLLVPGACFGFSDRVRLGFGGTRNSFEKGLSILQHHLWKVTE